MRNFIFLIVLLIPLLQVPAESATLEVEWEDSLLIVNAEDVPLSDILESISRKAGIDIVGSEYLDEPRTIHFAHLSLQEGVKKLLSHMNYIMLEKTTKDGGCLPVHVVIVGDGAMPAEALSYEKNNGLHNPDPGIRLARIQELIRMNPDRIEFILHSATQDADPTIRELAYTHLMERGDKEVSSILLSDARSKDTDIRKVALSLLGGLSTPDAVETLKQATEDNNIDIRYTAIQQLAQMKSSEGIAVIKERLLHPDPEIKIMAIEAMASQGEELALEAALLTVNDSNETVRNTAERIRHELESKQKKGGDI